jgi:hypothetical protein
MTVGSTLKIGTVSGVAFFLHAMVPNSNAWPMLWPAAAGAVGVMLARRGGHGPGFMRSIGIGLKTGIVAGVVFFAATVVALWLLSTEGLAPFARELGAEGPINLSVATLAGLAFAAMIGSALAPVTAGAAYPFARARS